MTQSKLIPPAEDSTDRDDVAPAGDAPSAARSSAELLRLLYDELRDLAQARMAREPGGGAGLTLQPTALVHEAYLRISGDDGATGARPKDWDSRGHFFGAAAI